MIKIFFYCLTIIGFIICLYGLFFTDDFIGLSIAILFDIFCAFGAGIYSKE